ncbi:MAG: alpha/beta hydrolase [Anaerolineaceae bacterium]|nr:alpha/beta hydrolase [Anaerolineaceae bacterium]
MAAVARVLARQFGVLEPIQTAGSVNGQVEELRQILEEKSAWPVTLIGYSWGAWLTWITAARYPLLVRKLILVSSGPFEEGYVTRLTEARQERLTADERQEFARLLHSLSTPETEGKDGLLARLGALAEKTDSFDPIKDQAEADAHTGPSGDIFQGVWSEAARLRRSGELLGMAFNIQCPVTAIHGDYDPHPAEGVTTPLAARLARFHFHILEHCGHTPWKERLAKQTFYNILIEEAASL